MKNDVEVKGVIVNKFETAKAVLVTVSTRDASPIVNYPCIVFLKDNMEQAKLFDQYEHVTITGNVQSSIRRNDKGKTYVKQSIFGETIEITEKTLEKEFGIEAGKYPAGENRYAIEGEIASVQAVSNGVLSLRIRTVKNNHISYVKAIHYTKNAKKLVETLRKGDIVCGIGSIQTRKKEHESGTKTYYENVVLSEISKK